MACAHSPSPPPRCHGVRNSFPPVDVWMWPPEGGRQQEIMGLSTMNGLNREMCATRPSTLTPVWTRKASLGHLKPITAITSRSFQYLRSMLHPNSSVLQPACGSRRDEDSCAPQVPELPDRHNACHEPPCCTRGTTHRQQIMGTPARTRGLRMLPARDAQSFEATCAGWGHARPCSLPHNSLTLGRRAMSIAC